MQLTELVLKGAEKLSPEERGFLVLAGQFSNEVTLLQKLLMCSSREFTDTVEDQAHSTLTVMFAKMLACKIWQGWELIDSVFQGARVSRANWLRQNGDLTVLIRNMRTEFEGECLLKQIRNQFGYHYDLEPIESYASDAVSEHGFSVLYTDRIINSFYPSSEVIGWSAMLDAPEPEDFAKEFPKFIDYVAKRAGDFMDLLNMIMEAFFVHVVNDLGGELEEVSKYSVRGEVPCAKVTYPVFLSLSSRQNVVDDL